MCHDVKGSRARKPGVKRNTLDQELGKTGLSEHSKKILGQDALVKAPKVAVLLEHDLVMKSAEGLFGPQSRSI